MKKKRLRSILIFSLLTIVVCSNVKASEDNSEGVKEKYIATLGRKLAELRIEFAGVVSDKDQKDFMEQFVYSRKEVSQLKRSLLKVEAELMVANMNIHYLKEENGEANERIKELEKLLQDKQRSKEEEE